MHNRNGMFELEVKVEAFSSKELFMETVADSSCRQWQITGKPCSHAIAWICSNRGVKIDDYVHEYNLVARFKAAYAGRVEPMSDRSQWPEVDLEFKVYPPLLGRALGRPKVQRRRGCLENNPNKKKVKCKRCGGFGHFEKTCKEPMVGEDGETSSKNKRYDSHINLVLSYAFEFNFDLTCNFHKHTARHPCLSC